MVKEIEEKKSMTKEEEVKERALSHTPRASHMRTHTRTCEELRTDISAYSQEERKQLAMMIPTFEQVKSVCYYTLNFRDDEFIEQWYRDMNASFWCDEFGNAIKNWGFILTKWARNAALFKKLRDPERIPDARKSRGGRSAAKRPTSFLEATEEQRKEFEDGLA